MIGIEVPAASRRGATQDSLLKNISLQFFVRKCFYTENFYFCCVKFVLPCRSCIFRYSYDRTFSGIVFTSFIQEALICIFRNDLQKKAILKAYKVLMNLK